MHLKIAFHIKLVTKKMNFSVGDNFEVEVLILGIDYSQGCLNSIQCRFPTYVNMGNFPNLFMFYNLHKYLDYLFHKMAEMINILP